MTTTEISHADSLDAEQEGYKQSLGSRSTSWPSPTPRR